MRTGLAAAKGLCEAVGVRLAGVSRLEVLADAAGVSEGLVALDAGRGQVYVREVVSGREWVCGDADLDRRGTTERLPSEDEHRKNAGLVVADEKVALRLASDGAVLRRLHVRDALGVVLRRLGEHEPMRDGVVDANYVRAEQEIYAKVGERKPAVPFAMTGE
jgi:tRNA threonylcarbamoyladenosine biosynthesis protein TsaB